MEPPTLSATPHTDAVQQSLVMAAAKWLCFVCCMWILSTAGTSGTFAIYSPVLKAVAGYDQKHIQALAVAKDVGESVGLVAGILCDWLPGWLMLLVGALHYLTGFGSLWLVASQRIQPLPFWQMCSLILVGAQGTAWFNTAALVTCIRNSPRSRGPVVGVLKGLVGLSNAILSQAYSAFLAPNQPSFLLVLAVVPLAVAVPTMSFVRSENRVLYDDIEEKTSFEKVVMSCTGLACYLLVAICVEDQMELTSQIRAWIFAGMLFFLVTPLAVPAAHLFEELHLNLSHTSKQDEQCDGEVDVSEADDKLQPLIHRVLSTDSIFSDFSPSETPAYDDKENQPLHCSPHAHLSSEMIDQESGDLSHSQKGLLMPDQERTSNAHPVLDVHHRGLDEAVHRHLNRRRSSQILLAVGEGAIRTRRKGPRRGEDFTLVEALRKADFWLLVLSYICGCGSGLTAINNLAQMASSQDYSRVQLFVSLVSVWNFIGRLAGGYCSEHLVKTYFLPRPLLLLVAQLVMSAGHAIYAIAFPYSLHIGSLIVGLCYGVHWSVMPATVSELFGLKNFGLIFNAVAAATPVGSYLFSSLIAGYLYDYEAHKGKGMGSPWQQSLVQAFSSWRLDSSEFTECTGAHCFRLTFTIMMGVCWIGAMFTGILVWRTTRVYVTLYRKGGSSHNL
ncbi:unnamed protein product [Closterium sp. Yama58-4]|nr:unnamed protein product [Closterium sp. Yama58-4]